MRFDSSREVMDKFLSESSKSTVELTKITSPQLDGKWQSIAEGTPIESGSYVNRVDGCDNDITVDVVSLSGDSVRTYVDMVCAS